MSQNASPQSPPKTPPALDKPPEQPQQPQGPPPIETIFQPVQTECIRAPEEAPAELIVTFTVMDGLSIKRHTYLVQEAGKAAFMDAVTGGLVVP